MRTIKPVEIFGGFARNQDELGARLCVQVALEKYNQPVIESTVNTARPGEDRIALEILSERTRRTNSAKTMWIEMASASRQLYPR